MNGLGLGVLSPPEVLQFTPDGGQVETGRFCYQDASQNK